MINIMDHQALIVKIAKPFFGSMFALGYTYEDVIQIGNVGALKAVNKFDESKGYKFITYMTHYVRGEIQHVLRDEKFHENYGRGTEKIINSSLDFIVSESSGKHLTMGDLVLSDDDSKEYERIELLDCISRLNEREKKVIYLFYFKEMNQPQIVKLLNSSRGKVSMALTTARRKLRKEMII